jgi:polyhydroxyalkanoate synthase subunit PhaC
MANTQAKRSIAAAGRRPAGSQTNGAPNGSLGAPRASTSASNGEGAASLDQALRATRARLTGGISPIALSLAFADWATHLAQMPGRQAELLMRAWEGAAKLAAAGVRLAEPEADGDGKSRPADPRFAGPSWRKWPFSMLSQAFLRSEEWWKEATSDVPGVSEHHLEIVSFWARQMVAAVSPSNFFWTNPEVMQTTVEERGANLVRGAALLAEDWRRRLAEEPPVGAEAFAPGESVAVTPGKVVYRNRLIELIQYEPATETVHPEPVLIVSAPIMKYYILDLSPHNSLIRYLVDQGHTVFAVSWHNPTADDRDLGMEDYVELGPLAAVDAISEMIPEQPVQAVGYCLGGTLLAIAAAAMAGDGDDRLRSVSLFAAETDFTEPGEIGVFVDENQVSDLEDLMWAQGYLDSTQMGGSFALLRPHDLIYGPIVNEYLLGERPQLNDLMAWNADGTRLPYRMHTEYLTKLFLRNELFEGRYLVRGRPVTLGDIRAPMFVVTTVRDHVVPWRSAYKLNLVVESELTLVRTSGGHNAGIVSEPGHRGRTFQCAVRPAGAPFVDPDRWAAETPTQEGSWWPTWQEWLTKHSTAKTAPPPIGNRSAGYKPLGDAPGKYVLQR